MGLQFCYLERGFNRYGAVQDASERTDVHIGAPIQHICSGKCDFFAFDLNL